MHNTIMHLKSKKIKDDLTKEGISVVHPKHIAGLGFLESSEIQLDAAWSHRSIGLTDMCISAFQIPPQTTVWLK